MTETAFRVVVKQPKRHEGKKPNVAGMAELMQATLCHFLFDAGSVTVTPMDDALIKAAEDAVEVLDMTAKCHADDGIRFHCAAKLQDAIANARGGTK